MKLPQHPRGTSADIRADIVQNRAEAERQRMGYEYDDGRDILKAIGIALLIDAVVIGAFVLMVKGCMA